MEEIRAYIEYLELEVRKAATTVRGYRSDLQQYQAWLQTRDESVLGITNETARHYLRYLNGANLDPQTVRRRITACRSMYKWLIREGTVARNCFDGLDLPRLDDKLPDFIHPEEFYQLVSFPMDTPLDVRDRAILELLYSSGIRVGEMEHLTLGDIDIQRQTLRFFGKGSRERITVFGDTATRYLRQYILDARSRLLQRSRMVTDIVFLNRFGTPMAQNGIQQMMRTRSEQMLGKSVTPHMLRHSCATHMYNNGADLSIVAEMLGHRSVNTTRDFYASLGIDRLRRVHQETHPDGECVSVNLAKQCAKR